MTEDDAKTKVCPFRNIAAPPYNGQSEVQDGNCIASDCMMWIDERKCGGTTWLGGCGLKVRS